MPLRDKLGSSRLTLPSNHTNPRSQFHPRKFPASLKLMARNKPPKPLTEAPPEPDSSDDDQNSSSSSTEVEEEPEQQAQDEEDSSSASSDEEEREPQQQTPQKPQSTTTKKPVNDSSEEEEEEDKSPVLNTKLITSPSKPTSKPRSKPNVVALTAEKEKDKRPLEIENKEKEKGVSSKKPRKEKEKEKEKSTVVVQEGTKKQASVPFQRLYSEDDEIAILKGMIEYRAKKGADPMADVDDFFEFIKNLLHVDVTRGQFTDKIRRLKKRYYNSLDKKKKLTNPHEIKFFELCQKIWNSSDEKVGNGVVENSNLSAKSNPKARVLKIKSAGNGPVAEEQKTKIEEERKMDWKISECDEKNVDMEIGEDASKERLRKKGLRLMGAKVRAEISEMWDKVVMAQLEVDELRHNALKEENRRIIEALKSGKP